MKPSTRTLYSYLKELAAAAPQKRLLGSGREWLNAGQTLALVESAASELLRLGVKRGELVALRASRSLEAALTLLALQAIGATAVLTAPWGSVEDVLADCAVSIPIKTVISNEWAAQRPWDGRNQVIMDVRTGAVTQFDPFEVPCRVLPEQKTDAQDPGFIIFTSGSTGKSKAVVLSQYNLVNNLIDSQPLGCYSEDDIALGALPMEHVFGLVLFAGAIVLRYGLYLAQETDISSLLSDIQSQRITRMNAVPSLYLAMARGKEGHDLTSLRAGFIGGGPSTPEQFHLIERELGMTLIPVYGMSEFVGISCADWRDSSEVRSSGVGRFYSMNRGVILADDGLEAPPGIEGEICVGGPAHMVGYYGDTAAEEFYFHTGDLGWLDGTGCLHISGRKKDIIIRNGTNLSSARIERALLSVPGVRDAAVVALADEQAGEVPWAMVVCGREAPSDLSAALRGALPKNAIPAGICQVARLPMTASGKPDKQHIREVLSQWRAM